MKQIANFGGSTTSTAKETIAKVKTSRETVTSSTSLQDDNDFSFELKASTTYAINATLYISAPSTGGFKFAFTVPSGSSGRMNSDSSQAALIYPDMDISISTASSSSAINMLSGGSSGRFFGFITTSSTAGTLLFRWAQDTSNATGTYIERGSTMILTEV